MPAAEPNREDAARMLSLSDNGYDLIRLLLAAAVVYSHSYVLGGFGAEPLRQFSKEDLFLGKLAVLGFFGLSGFLVAASFERSRGFVDFFSKRVRRILPGYWVCLAVTAFVLAPLIWLAGGRQVPSFAWWGPDSAATFVASNFLLRIHQWSVSGVLEGQVWTSSLNGSLWSLYPEFLCYVGLAALGFGGALHSSRWLLALALFASMTYHVVSVVGGAAASFPDIPTICALTDWAPFITAFVAGMCACAWRGQIRFDWRTLVVLLGAAALTIKFGGFNVVSPLLVTALVLIGGGCFRWRLPMDLSYGMYITRFRCNCSSRRRA
jgi:peptidoglycan/LPS O-acetylase OafA/YrhL